MEWSLTKIKSFLGCRRYFSRRYGNVPPENPEPLVFFEGIEFHAKVQSILKGEDQNDIGLPEKLIGLPWEFEKRFNANIDGYDFVGVVDAFYQPSEGHVFIAEIKSYPSDREDIYFQLSIYANLMAEQSLQLPLATFISITPNRIIEELVEPDTYLKYGRRLVRIVEWIEREMQEYPESMEKPNPGAMCTKCQWRASCPALRNNPTVEEVTRNPELLAQRLLSLELELNDLKEIARAIVESGGQVKTGEFKWDYDFIEELEVDPLQVYNYLIEKNINPFAVPIGRMPKSMLKVDSRVFKDFARKIDPDISNLAEIKVSKRFGRKKVENEE
jgi:CRISPR/Cas system-associated exonuclease Cas4 (RecB family)